MNDAAPAKSRIVIALDAAEHRDYAIEVARWLVPAQTLELLGVFVEDETLLEYARSKWAREILATGVARTMNRGVIERRIQAQAARARARFEAATAHIGVAHRFMTARGNLLFEPIRQAVGAQALIVGAAGSQSLGAAVGDFLRQLAAGPPLVFLARQGWLPGRGIAVIASDGDDPLLEAAARIAKHANSPVVVLVTDGEPPERDRAAERIAHRLRQLGIDRFRTITLLQRDASDIILAARSCSARLLVMQSPPTTGDSRMSAELLRRFSGALMFVRLQSEKT